MANDTEIGIDIEVSGAPSLRDAANALAAINSSLGDMSRSLTQAIKALDKTEQSFAGVRRGKRDIDSLAQAAKDYYKVIDTNKGKSVTIKPVDSKPLDRGADGQFVSPKISQNAAAMAKEANAATLDAIALNKLAESRSKVTKENSAFNTSVYRNSAAQGIETTSTNAAAAAHTKNQQTLQRLRQANLDNADASSRVTAANNTFGTAISRNTTLAERLRYSLAENNRELPQLRYSLFSVAQSLGIVAAALITVNALTLKTAIDYEKRFAEVRRTTGLTGEAAEQLKKDLIELQQTLPISNEQINQIAALAGQLGIAEDQVGSFTETTAKFAATTDVTVEAAATAFGRLDSLLPDVQGNYEGLASSILEVGINSVATESQIISISSQIAAAGAQSGLSADEVIGLSAAFASLGVAPESARGTVLRVFSEINSAIAGGGKELEQFAAISGMTADTFRTKWTNGGFTEVFTNFLSGVGSKGVAAETALNALGITATRDVNSMLKLAQNSGDVAKYLGLSAEGLESNTRLGASFGIIAETTSAKLTVLANSFEALVATLGEGVAGNPLGELVSGITDLINGFQKIMDNPVGQSIAGFAIILSGLVGVLALVTAGVAAGAAGFLAFQTLAGSATVATLGLTGAVNVLGSAIKTTLISSGIGIAVVLLGTLASALYTAATATEDADAAVNDYFGDLSSLQAAIKADNAAGANTATNYAKVTSEVNKTSDTVTSWQKQLESATGAQAHVAEALQTTNDKVIKQTFNLGENTKAWYANSLANDENVQKLFASAESLAAYGFEGTTLIEKIVGDPEADGSDALEYIQQLKDAAKEAILSTGVAIDPTESALQQKQLENVDKAFEGAEKAAKAYGKSAKTAANQVALANTVNKALGVSTEQVGDETEGATDALKDQIDAIFAASNASLALQNSLMNLGQVLAQSGANSGEFRAALQGVINGILATPQSAASAAGSILGFYQAMLDSGTATVAQLALVKEAYDSIAAGLNGAKVVAKDFDLTNFVSGMKNGAVAAQSAAGGTREVAKEVRTLVDVANDLRGVLSRAFDIRTSVQAAKDAITSATKQMKADFEEADKDVVQFRKELSAAKDEARDAFSKTYAEAFVDALSDGMSRAVSDAFDRIEAYDTITETFHNLTDAITESKDALKDLQAQLLENGADLSTKQFQLGVAQQYGDTLAIEKLTADIATLQSKRSDLNKQVVKEQSTQSRETMGNSDAALANRESLRGLVSDYKDYIETLAAAGASTEMIGKAVTDTKNDFLAQAKALGFSDEQLQPYAQAFDRLGGANVGADTSAVSEAAKAQADADQAVADAASNLAEAKSRASRETAGNTLAAIRNREALRDLEGQVNEYAGALVASGVSSAGVRSELGLLEGKLNTSLAVMGLAKDDGKGNGAKPLADAFDAITTAIGKIPPATIKFNGNDAQQAINEFLAANTKGKGASGGVTIPVTTSIKDPKGDGAAAAEEFSRGFRQKLENGHIKILLRDGSFYIQGNPRVIGQAKGGPVVGPGTNTSDSIPRMLSNNEYVVKASSAQSLGTPMMNYLNKYGSLPGFAAGGVVGGGSAGSGVGGIMELGPRSLSVLREAVSKEVSVYLGDTDVARSANRGNQQLAYQGK